MRINQVLRPECVALLQEFEQYREIHNLAMKLTTDPYARVVMEATFKEHENKVVRFIAIMPPVFIYEFEPGEAIPETIKSMIEKAQAPAGAQDQEAPL